MRTRTTRPVHTSYWSSLSRGKTRVFFHRTQTTARVYTCSRICLVSFSRYWLCRSNRVRHRSSHCCPRSWEDVQRVDGCERWPTVKWRSPVVLWLALILWKHDGNVEHCGKLSPYDQRLSSATSPLLIFIFNDSTDCYPPHETPCSGPVAWHVTLYMSHSSSGYWHLGRDERNHTPPGNPLAFCGQTKVYLE